MSSKCSKINRINQQAGVGDFVSSLKKTAGSILSSDGELEEVVELVWENINNRIADNSFLGWFSSDDKLPTESDCKFIIKSYINVVQSAIIQTEFDGKLFENVDDKLVTIDKKQQKLIAQVVKKSGRPEWYVKSVLLELYELTQNETILDKSYIFPKTYGNNSPINSRNIKITLGIAGMGLVGYLIYRGVK